MTKRLIVYPLYQQQSNASGIDSLGPEATARREHYESIRRAEAHAQEILRRDEEAGVIDTTAEEA